MFAHLVPAGSSSRVNKPGSLRVLGEAGVATLTDQAGFPLIVSVSRCTKAETKTMLPVVESFMTAQQLPDVAVVADEAGYRSSSAYASRTSRMWRPGWRREHPDEEMLPPATSPSKSRSAPIPSLRLTLCPTTYAEPSKRSP
jgi:hypothetical protein